VEGDPVGACNFEVELGDEAVGFSEVLGLGYEPERRTVSPVTLRRGAGLDLALWAWARKPAPRTVTITLLDASLRPACRYVLHGARPVKYTGPELNANGTDVAMEELVLAAEGLEIESR
jgi:phage tail-like protein